LLYVKVTLQIIDLNSIFLIETKPSGTSTSSKVASARSYP
jgi:hypothetical protein